MPQNPIYSDEDKAHVKAILEANRGPDGTYNISRTARETGITRTTLRKWVRKWEEEGPPPEVQEVLPEAREQLVGALEKTRNKALEALDMRLNQLIKDKTGLLLKVNPKDLATTAAILTDKARLVEGKSTSRTEGISEGNLPIEQVRELFAGFAKGIVEGARQRDAAISSAMEEEPIEAEFTEQAVPALPTGF